LHKPPQEYVPDFARDFLVELRARWNTLRYGKTAKQAAPAAAQAQNKAGGSA